MIVAILGRIPALGVAECECVFGRDAVEWFGDMAAKIDAPDLDVERFGSIVKAGRVVAEFPARDWRDVSRKIIQNYTLSWSGHEQKITLGISCYGFDRLSPRDIQKTGLVLKQKLKSSPGSLRLIPNDDSALSSATSHHNKLGLSDNKVELLIVHDRRSGKTIVAESLGAQNITALARRDQGRPKRDAFVGMLPPKLALTMVNLAIGDNSANTAKSGTSFSEDSAFPAAARQDRLTLAPSRSEEKDGAGLSGKSHNTPRVLDPFCGTGVILQEAALLGYDVYGTDLAEKMVDYSQQNMQWLVDTHHVSPRITVEHGDAMTTKWQLPIDAVAAETYLGQPFSAPPSPTKLREVRGNCNHIITDFLTNLHGQIASGTPLCIAIPAWRDIRGNFTHLPLTTSIEELGYKIVELKNVTPSQLLYYREDQVVARELLILARS